MPALKKLMRLREWLNVPEAARHLSILFGEDVTEADVLRLALDGHLTLSVNLVNQAKARCGPAIPLADAERRTIQTLDNQFFHTIDGLYLGNDRVLVYKREVNTLEGIWDLPLIGQERVEIEHKYQLLTGGPTVDLHSFDGPLVSHPDGTWGEILERFSENPYFNKNNLKSPYDHPDNYYPAGQLPPDAVLVVRTSALQKLEALISKPEPAAERPVARRERTTLLMIIAALAKLAKIDVAKPSSAAAAIESETIQMGARVAARTIEEHLRRIPEARENKSAD